ncbi:SDR family NAD(P)-dependent oxidoreductase [Kibdelosporangium aridum]|uniref:SDR family NAD(P)-dependent oxidoreductase n=1 Tax=Kibdelosporangium aridum TaxID=2030 RepID=A0A428ZH51_KIBAR|nr:SDR family oxidoreductase [Kibdelosporangium aridum]RSM87395.1 SDR family NAD(P)-dependent oxidoreductase [Kibdelosporangium aridum]
MVIAVAGATGHLGRHVIEALLAKGVPASDIVGVGRQVDKIADLGITVRQASYDDPDSLKAAFAGADKLLLISGSEVGQRVPQHTNVIEAAKEAGVGLVVYTSGPKADTSDMKLMGEHLATERLLGQSGLPHVIVRNNWYFENYDVQQAIEHGLFGAAGDGKIGIASRADYAEAAAAVLIGEGHEGRVYELAGPPVTLAELAAEISRHSGKPVAYNNLGEDDFRAMLVNVGLPEPVAATLADADRAASNGALDVPPTHLTTLLGRPATPLADLIRASLSEKD